MKYRISPPQVFCSEIALPSSKSISNRALVIHALSGADASLLHHVSDCDDTFVMQRALRLLASEQSEVGEAGFAADIPATIDIMAAGTSMRFLTALLSVVPGCHFLTGSERMCRRPIAVLVDALRRIGADIAYAGEEGFPPLFITGGTLKGGRLDIAGDVSSQYISALLMIAPLLTDGLELHLKGQVISRPYIRMTVEMMRRYGADVQWRGNRIVRVAHRSYVPTPYYIEGDWSASSYWFEMMVLSRKPGDHVIMRQLYPRSLQGDAEVRRVFAQLGVASQFISPQGSSPGLLVAKKASVPSRLDYDFCRIPDLAQSVVVACCLLGVPFRLTGLQTLRIKETDRIAALSTELQKMGVRLEVTADDTLYWDGPNRQKGGGADYLKPTSDVVVDTYDDHRMAMAFAPAALVLGRIYINNPEVVSKSYPAYWDDLRRAGFHIEEINS